MPGLEEKGWCHRLPRYGKSIVVDEYSYDQNFNSLQSIWAHLKSTNPFRNYIFLKFQVWMKLFQLRARSEKSRWRPSFWASRHPAVTIKHNIILSKQGVVTVLFEVHRFRNILTLAANVLKGKKAPLNIRKTLCYQTFSCTSIL